ncbi:MAG: PPK2 family polyphosphate kinase [Gammaproteobacteria bacterium]
MFTATTHSLLVPYDGTFDARNAPTTHENDHEKDGHWKDQLETETKALGDAQYRLYADGRFALLLVFQALDAAGKDSTIRHVLAGVNPCGLEVTPFKQPSRAEVAHDFLWRSALRLPERGNVAVFNRSYYEEVIVVRVHPQFLAAQHQAVNPRQGLWTDRCRAIVDHERHLAEEGTVILKFWLNISKDEQRDRLLDRIDDPVKNWKFNPGDLDERDRWDDYLTAYHECLNATSRPWAPWYAIPADNKHYARWQVAKLVNEALTQLGVDFPRPAGAALGALAQCKARLVAS